MAFLRLLFCLALAGAAFGCGVPAISPFYYGVQRMVRGKIALPGAWPWIVSLRNITTGKHYCGGSLINETWVVTAAHCEVSPSDLVMAGMLNQRIIDKDVQVLKIAQVFNHPGHNKSLGVNDFALLKLATPARLSQLVSPVCLPQAEDNYPGGSLCLMAGWGRTSLKGKLSSRLRQGDVRILSEAQCKSHWDDGINDDNVCAGRAGISICMGDSGGPLVCQKDGAWSLVGIMSRVHHQCSTRDPGVFTRVKDFLPWIQEIMAQN